MFDPRLFDPAAISDEIRRQNADIVAKLADLGLEPVGGSPEELGQFQKAEIEKWAKVVKEANVKPE